MPGNTTLDSPKSNNCISGSPTRMQCIEHFFCNYIQKVAALSGFSPLNVVIARELLQYPLKQYKVYSCPGPKGRLFLQVCGVVWCVLGSGKNLCCGCDIYRELGKSPKPIGKRNLTISFIKNRGNCLQGPGFFFLDILLETRIAACWDSDKFLWGIDQECPINIFPYWLTSGLLYT